MCWAGPHQIPIGRRRLTDQEGEPAPPPASFSDPDKPVLLCFSHLRWNFVYQRPQHLMSRFARTHRVVFFEEPLPTEQPEPWLEKVTDEGLQVLTPRLPEGYPEEQASDAQRKLLDRYLAELRPGKLIAWYYTPMSLDYAGHLKPDITVYDCMDELSGFKGAPPELVEKERELIARADTVFTGGVSLGEAKRALHANVHAFPSSVDVPHFAQARQALADPPDQAHIPSPRLGYYGVIDERLDLALLDELARQRPHWNLILVGPVVKIDPATLPDRHNIHYLGGKVYDELPHYLAGWDVAMMPFALNEATRFISPTKTPEYLAGGRPVVSTPITDVVRTYGDTGVVRIAQSSSEFISATEQAFEDLQRPEEFLGRADDVLRGMSWDTTWKLMEEKIQCAV